jgi:hypothetical protein
MTFDSDYLFQKLGSFLVRAAHPVEIGHVHQGRDKTRVETQCRPILRLRLGHLPAPQVQQSKIEMSLGPVRVDHLGGYEFLGGIYHRGLQFWRQ